MAATSTKATSSKSSSTTSNRVVELVRNAGHSYLDTTEKAAESLAEFQESVGQGTGIDLISSVAGTQAGITRDVARAYVSASRKLIS